MSFDSRLEKLAKLYSRLAKSHAKFDVKVSAIYKTLRRTMF